ncbi:hypothetical protein [Aliamphritea hakodatensis]|uniref:hypothetical protein n=1 Tax=Aliamphritea hakodatensis TaxID=2895352 RepID=UPI0022FD55F8|nr:hypothetical protein [Aliamphritea hakodatensis]
MSSSEQSIQRDAEQMQQWLAGDFDTTSVASFKPGPGIAKLDLKFDIDELRKCYFELQKHVENLGSGFHALALTRRPGVEVPEPYDLVGRFWTRTDDTYQEYARDEMVDESLFTEFNPLFKDTYFEEVHKQLIARFPIGRMRVLKKDIYNCNSWHRDPEPRLHIPVISNPGSLFIVNHHCTHLPADGSVYFTDTRGYHTALNGGEDPRVHIVAALPYEGAMLTDEQVASQNF